MDQLSIVIELISCQQPVLIFISHLVQLVIYMLALSNGSTVTVCWDVLVIHHLYLFKY